MTTFEILKILEFVLRIAKSAGVNYQKYAMLRQQAEAEGRELSDEELQSLADDAQASIDRLRE